MTDPDIDRVVEDPTDVDPHRPAGPPGSFRDEPTAAAETRTVKWGKAAPWLATPDPEPRPRPRDPLFWPALVFVSVLSVVIGYMLLSQPGGSRSRGAAGLSFP